MPSDVAPHLASTPAIPPGMHPALRAIVVASLGAAPLWAVAMCGLCLRGNPVASPQWQWVSIAAMTGVAALLHCGIVMAIGHPLLKADASQPLPHGQADRFLWHRWLRWLVWLSPVLALAAGLGFALGRSPWNGPAALAATAAVAPLTWLWVAPARRAKIELSGSPQDAISDSHSHSHSDAFSATDKSLANGNPDGVSPAESSREARGLVRRVERGRSADGTEWVTVWERVELAPWETQTRIHVPFWPPLSAVPDVEGDVVASAGALTVEQVETYGCRLRVEVEEADERPQHVEIEATARWAPDAESS